jgi:hypothetical protein
MPLEAQGKRVARQGGGDEKKSRSELRRGESGVKPPHSKSQRMPLQKAGAKRDVKPRNEEG